MHTHASALSFINWCSKIFEFHYQDCFSSHAPFHFDLSIFDIYLPIKHGAKLVLIDENMNKQPKYLAEYIFQNNISIWYSTPSILKLLIQYGQMERYDFKALRYVFFAGEVFPVKYLREIKALWPHPRYFNLYGPTETNVCTYYEVPKEIPAQRQYPYPIGRVCSNDDDKVIDKQMKDVECGQVGELCIRGGSLMHGYWGKPDQTAQTLFRDEQNNIWYQTGDIVQKNENGDYIFLGRKDRMIKRRGYRIELGEIENISYRHPAVHEAAAFCTHDQKNDVVIQVCLDCGEEKPSLIDVKKFYAKNLPLYMIPDRVTFLLSLPKTSTGKIDYQTLKATHGI